MKPRLHTESPRRTLPWKGLCFLLLFTLCAHAFLAQPCCCDSPGPAAEDSALGPADGAGENPDFTAAASGRDDCGQDGHSHTAMCTHDCFCCVPAVHRVTVAVLPGPDPGSPAPTLPESDSYISSPIQNTDPPPRSA